MLCNGVTFVFSACCLLHIKNYSFILNDYSSQSYTLKRFISETRLGIACVMQNLEIAFRYLVYLFLFTTVKTINVLLAPFVRDVLYLGASEFGYIDATFAAGAIVSSLLLPQLMRKYNAEVIALFCIFLLSSSLIFFSTSNNFWIAVSGYFLIGLFIQTREYFLTKAQIITDDEFQGRVYSIFNIFMSVSSLAIYIFIGTLIDIYSSRFLYVFQALLIAIVGLIVFLRVKTLR